MEEEIDGCNESEIQDLLLYFSKNTYRAKESDHESQRILDKCIELMSLDYNTVLVNNANGELSAHYPAQIVIMEHERAQQPGSPSPELRSQDTIYESMCDVSKLKELFGKAKPARCRGRFPVPVIYFKGKYVCRSATLSGGIEIYGRSGLDFLSTTETDSDSVQLEEEMSGNWQLFNRVRSHDIRLLQTLNIGTIVDFMVEKKKVKYGINVSSSEKVDKENRYADFKIVSLPYPGCEFFKNYRDNDYIANGLVFDWEQAYADAVLEVPDEPIAKQLKINWDDYKMWDLKEMTENYVRLLVRYMSEGSTGMLVHCISGWDRTPLFISLLRLSLWADGVTHRSLSTRQILYLTLAYDWMLFGHDLVDRLSKGEEILFFCFYMLKAISGDEFSVNRKEKNMCKQPQPVIRTDSESHLEGVLFEAGSQGSLNSSWSSLSSKSQEAANFYCTDDTNGNAVHVVASQSSSEQQRPVADDEADNGNNHCNHSKAHTSPVAVPSRSMVRHRNESTGSLNVGSWQFITGSGSLRGSSSSSSNVTTRYSDTTFHEDEPARLAGDTPTGPTPLEDDCFIYSNGTLDAVPLRSERLRKVRELFLYCFCSTIGLRTKDGSEKSLTSQALNSIVEQCNKYVYNKY
ncbi:myotubularin-related protein 14 isoform X1 [Nilaparvata lugens]|uniref:myotubularin-related protein 14 isoform X1 n=1 Tax=Nilaparvata lugens TaxID=108931 RepID=UPI00193D60A6|nr:myotubularin-related protein 14 isoform X1 [Nilaparvata lugens]